MGRDINKYHGNYFEANDALLGVWAHLMANEIDRAQSIPAWLLQLRDHWRGQAEIGALVNLGLDEFITDDGRVARIFQLVRDVDGRLDEYGAEVPIEELQRTKMLTISWGNTGLEANLVRKVNRTVFKLLTGGTEAEAGAYPIGKWS